jgi:hypothetical protein
MAQAGLQPFDQIRDSSRLVTCRFKLGLDLEAGTLHGCYRMAGELDIVVPLRDQTTAGSHAAATMVAAALPADTTKCVSLL